VAARGSQLSDIVVDLCNPLVVKVHLLRLLPGAA